MFQTHDRFLRLYSFFKKFQGTKHANQALPVGGCAQPNMNFASCVFVCYCLRMHLHAISVHLCVRQKQNREILHSPPHRSVGFYAGPVKHFPHCFISALCLALSFGKEG